MAFLTCEIRTLTGESIGVLVLEPKTFKSGSTGYFATGKVTVDGVRYQGQVQLVAIGSKGEGGKAVDFGG